MFPPLKTSHEPVSSIPILQYEDKDVHSPDGSMNLTLKIKNLENGLFSYSFFVSSLKNPSFTKATADKQKLLFSSVGKKGDIWITSNAWSPDNKYVYILKKENGVPDALIFKGSGESFADGKAYIELLPIFTKKGTGYLITNVTGWDSDTLLHVVTVKEKEKGPSFWFEVPSTAVIQLYG